MADSHGLKTEQLEIYRQRYETFRHLDKLRWQMLQIAVAAGSVVLAFGDGSTANPEQWAVVATGIIFLVLGAAMMRINGGIKKNGEVLRKVGKQVGDTDFATQSSNIKSVSFWIAVGMIVVGIASISLPIFF